MTTVVHPIPCLWQRCPDAHRHSLLFRSLSPLGPLSPFPPALAKKEKTMHLLKPALVILASLLLSGMAFATETGSMRCDGGIVSVGDTAGEVINKCGQPAYATQRLEKVIDQETKGYYQGRVAEITVDDWTFNFGPNQFQYEVILKNGRVYRIESLNNYGY